MSLKEQVNEEVKKIVDTVSNEAEKKVVLSSVENILNIFTDVLVKVTERQSELENRVEEVFDTLTQIEEELVESFDEEFEAECPYCGEKVPLKFPEDDESTDIECPKCHNMVELELMLDNNCGCGCDECHSKEACDCDECKSDDEDEE